MDALKKHRLGWIGAFILRREDASQCGLGTEHGKIIPRHHLRPHRFGFRRAETARDEFLAIGSASRERQSLQRARLIISPGHHSVHHAAPYTRNYCITVGWLNGPLRAVRFFETLERVISAVTGAVPREDDLGSEKALKVAAQLAGGIEREAAAAEIADS